MEYEIRYQGQNRIVQGRDLLVIPERKEKVSKQLSKKSRLKTIREIESVDLAIGEIVRIQFFSLEEMGYNKEKGLRIKFEDELKSIRKELEQLNDILDSKELNVGDRVA